jgi:hypothetical protein
MPTNTTPWHACHCIALFIPYSANHPGSIHRLLLQESANRGRLSRFLIENLPPYRMPHDRNSFDAEACSADSQLPPSPHRTEIDEDDSGTRNTDSLGHASALHRAARELSARLLTWRVTVGRVVYEGQPVASGFSTFLPIAETVRPQDRSAGRGAFPCGLPFCVDTFADLSMGPSSVNIASKRRLPSPETKTS